MPKSSSLTPDVFGARHALESYNIPESCDVNQSFSDLSLSDVSSVDFRNKMDGMKNVILSDSSPITIDNDVHVPADQINETSFNPLEYDVDDHCDRTSDSPDVGTLSGMLKYIKEEMKLTDGLQTHNRKE
ncbi:hypothetical protein GDO78_015687 [Eleutherodactylus coqui]|uniref:Uncharacterized protein n=2 Tax=Eleutherodactylus coqui TaxID=57060 RepID=A0A8J6BFX8_ELECQ|nr:hypothetical protein GDO78_015687 [Eleutherodactylus coqui]